MSGIVEDIRFVFAYWFGKSY